MNRYTILSDAKHPQVRPKPPATNSCCSARTAAVLIFVFSATAIWIWSSLTVPAVIPYRASKTFPPPSMLEDLAEDNHGAPAHSTESFQGFAGGLAPLTADCDWGYTKFSDKFESAQAHWYKDSDSYARYDGYNLVPENYASFSPSTLASMLHSGLDTTHFGSRVLGGSCVKEDGDGGTWVVERIGPFSTHGGYDWLQFEWTNAFGLREVLDSNPDSDLYITHSFSATVDESGESLGFPPIHVHHVHASPGKSGEVPMKGALTGPLAKCLVTDSDECDHPYYTVFEQHGDYQCLDEDGGTDCLLESLPDGYAKKVTTPLFINGELNDVRAKGSPDLVWWYQAAVRYITPKPREAPKPLSQHYIWSPGRLQINDQSAMVNTFLAPTDQATILWYAGQMEFDGTLVRAKMHTHNTIFDEAYIFSATKEQVGMAGFLPPSDQKAYDVQYPRDLGFTSNEEIKAHVMAEYARNVDIPNAHGQLPRLICHGRTSHVEVEYTAEELHTAEPGAFLFDRRARVGCGNWTFERGEYFIVLGFNQKADSHPGPASPEYTPPYYPGHLHIFLSYDRHDNESHYTYDFYTQDPAMQMGAEAPNQRHILLGGTANTLTTLLNGGGPNLVQWTRWMAVMVVIAASGVTAGVALAHCVGRRVAQRVKKML